MKPGDPADPPTLPLPSAALYEPETQELGAADVEGTEGTERVRRVERSEVSDVSEVSEVSEVSRVRGGMIVAEDPTRASGTYAFGEVIGKGGMGEVLLAHDRRIGRDVAVKRLRAASPGPDETTRFLREARIQARLDHPAIVPVYELARDAQHRPYFTMKRLSGTTLSELLARGPVPRQRLLRAFVDVCRAVDFAHSRGVVHRDLKPGNIVLGEYGEVYVLDWGAALVIGDTPGGVLTADIDTLEGAAPAGHVLGTPGYMAPEQMRHPEVGRSADIYALGAILFELLAGEPLHPRTAPIPSTLSPLTVTSPAARRPDRAVPPELDALCVALLVAEPVLRPSARRCADAIEEFLDGDRDLERRRALALELVWQARAAYDAGMRAEAMRAASRALALDAHVEMAAELVTRLMLEPPPEPPPELREAIRHTDEDGIRRHARAALPGYLLIAAFLPVIIWNGILHWPLVLGTAAAALWMAYAAWRLVRQPDRSDLWMVLYGCGNAVMLALLSRISGSVTFVAAIVSFITASVVTYPAFLRRPWVLISLMLAGLLAPLALEALGALPSTWLLEEDGVLVRGHAMRIAGAPAIVTFAAASAATVVMAGVQSVKLARANRDAQHRLVVQAWHLRQLLPSAPAR